MTMKLKINYYYLVFKIYSGAYPNLRNKLLYIYSLKEH